MDLLRQAGMRGRTTAVVITGGGHAHESGDQWYVPKRELLTGLESSLESGELRIARRLPEAERLMKEFGNMKMEARVNGRWKMGAEGEGEHDGLVLALSLACWKAKRPGTGLRISAVDGHYHAVFID